MPARVTIRAALITGGCAVAAAIIGGLFVLFGKSGGNIQKNAPNAVQATQAGSGNFQATQSGSGNSQTVIFNSEQSATNFHDDLVLTVPSAFAADMGERYHSDVLFINNGSRDATIVEVGLWLEVPKGDMRGSLSLWRANESTVIPAGKAVPKRFEMTQFEPVRSQSTTNEDHIAHIACRVIDGDGNQHMLIQNIGKLRFSENGSKYYPLDGASQTMKLLPSQIYRGVIRTGVFTLTSTNPTRLDLLDDENTNAKAAR